MHIFLFINEHSGTFRPELKQRLEEQLHEFCQTSRGQYTIVTDCFSGFETISKKNSTEKKLFIAAGGDGTVAQVARYAKTAGAQLGIIPLGTGNIVARSLGLSHNPKHALRTALHSKKRQPLDALILDQQPHFLQLTVGFSALVMHKTDSKMKKLLGKAAYYLNALLHLHRIRPHSITLEIDGEMQTIATPELIINNNPYYLQQNFNIAHETRLDDGVIELYAIYSKPLALQWILKKLFRKENPLIYKVGSARKNVRLLDDSNPVQVDGDKLSTLPCTVTVAKRYIAVLC